MKLINYVVVAVIALAVIVSSGTIKTANAISGPGHTYCIYISPDNKMGFSAGCGYTYNECMRRLPGKLADYIKTHPQYPKATAGCGIQ